MGIDTRIYLNTHAKPKDIISVILKSLGHEFDYRSNKLKIQIDPNHLSSKSNPWKLVVNNSDYNIKLSDPEYFELNFEDPCKQKYQTLLFLNIEDDPNLYNNEKLLSPRANEIWLSIGKKLVDFFGGKMMYADCNSDTDPNNWYINKKGLFPKKTKSQDGDERWYQFQNCLNKVKRITKLELEDMKKHSAYPNDERIPNLKYYFDKLEMAEQLSKTLNKNNTKKNKSIKI